MVKAFAILLGMVAAIAINAQGTFSCFTYFTRSQPGTTGTFIFAGITTSGSNQIYDIPLFYSKANADLGFSNPSGVKGRFSGTVPLSTGIGSPMTFLLFSGGSKLFLGTYNKNTGMGNIKGGTGCFSGIRGTAFSKTYATTPVRSLWKICPTNAAYNCFP